MQGEGDVVLRGEHANPTGYERVPEAGLYRSADAARAAASARCDFGGTRYSEGALCALITPIKVTASAVDFLLAARFYCHCSRAYVFPGRRLAMHGWRTSHYQPATSNG